MVSHSEHSPGEDSGTDVEPVVEPVEEHDDELDELVVACVAALHEQGRAAVEALLQAHPDRAEEARRRLEVLGRAGFLDSPASPATADHPEQLGEFRLLERLGGGGMGVVYLARQEPLGREVALKLIRPEQHYFGGARERFRRELEAVARLDHPGIVPVYTVGEEQGLPYFAMQRVVGCTLSQALERVKGRNPAELRGDDLYAAVLQLAGAAHSSETPELFAGTWVQACLRVVRAMAEALEHTHRAGIVHRDVKPSNVMLTPEGRVMLLDFGLSRIEGASPLTHTGAAVGSLHYLPPEALAEKGAPMGVRGDVYSLGVTLYEALALAPPFDGPSAVAIAQRVVDASPTPLRRRNPSVSTEAALVAEVAMERDPERRYPSAGALANDLSNVLAQRPISARPTSFALRSRRWVQRSPGWAAAATLALLAATLGPSVFAWQAMSSAKALSLENARSLEMLKTAFEAVRESLVLLAGEDIRDVPHLERLQREILERAVLLYEQLDVAQRTHTKDDAAGRRLGDLRREALEVLARARAELGLAEPARAAWEELRTLARARLEAEPDHPDAGQALAEAELGLGRGAVDRRETTAGEAHAEAGLQAVSRLPRNLAAATLDLNLRMLGAEACLRGGRLEEAAWKLEEALAAAEDHLRAHGDAPELRERRANLRLTLGVCRFQLGDWEAAEQAYVAAAQELEELLPEALHLVQTKDRLVHARLDLGQLYRSQWRIEEAVAELERAVALQQDLAAAYPNAEHRQFELASALQSLGITLDFDDVRRADGYEALARARNLTTELLRKRPDDVDRVSVMGMVLAGMGTLRLHQAMVTESVPDAESYLEQALELYPDALQQYERARELAPDDLEVAQALRRGRLGYADVLIAAGVAEEAAAVLRLAADVEPPDWRELRMIAGRMLRCAEQTGDGADLVGESFALLSRAVDAGYADLTDLEGSPLMAPLRSLANYPELRARVSAAAAAAVSE